VATGPLSSFAATDFSLSDVPGNAELISMYDQYKICGVKITFIPQQTESNSLNYATGIRVARFYTAIDYTDAVPPATLSDIREYESCKVTSLLKEHTRYIPHPKYLLSNTQTSDEWTATSNSTINWFGLKFATDPTGTTGVNQFEFLIECTYYLCFKNIK